MVLCGSVPPKKHGGIEQVVDLYVNGLSILGHTASLIYEDFVINERYEVTHNHFYIPHGPLVIQNKSQLEWLESHDIHVANTMVHLLHWRSPAICANVISPSSYCSLLPRLQHKNMVKIPHPVYNDVLEISSAKQTAIPLESLSQNYLNSGEYFFVPARLCEFKNVRRALKLSKTMKMKLIWAGPVEDKGLLKLLTINGGIYVGNIGRSDVKKFMQKSAAVLCLTRYFPVAEAFGLFQVEALLYGAKVITSRSGGLYDTIYSPNTFTLPNGIPIRMFKRALSKFLEKPVQPVSSYYRDRYSNRMSAKLLVEFLESINHEPIK